MSFLGTFCPRPKLSDGVFGQHCSALCPSVSNCKRWSVSQLFHTATTPPCLDYELCVICAPIVRHKRFAGNTHNRRRRLTGGSKTKYRCHIYYISLFFPSIVAQIFNHFLQSNSGYSIHWPNHLVNRDAEQNDCFCFPLYIWIFAERGGVLQTPSSRAQPQPRGP